MQHLEQTQLQKRGVTMEAVGRLAGVSQVTVSRALSHPEKVSPKTLQKINEAIEATGFIPNAIAGALASSRSRLISALVPSLTNIVYSSTVKAFAEEMRQSEYQVMLSETGLNAEDEEKVIAAHLSRRPDAILLTGIHHTPKARKMLIGSGIPVIEVWETTQTPIFQSIGFSHRQTGRSVAEFAFQQGYKNAGVVSSGDERALRRQQAFVDKFEKLSQNQVYQVQFQAEASLKNGRSGLIQLINKGFEQGVIFCSSDILAHGVLIEAKVQGLSIPKDVAVIGFGDQDFAAHTSPALTTVRVDREALGRIAAEQLLQHFDQKPTQTTAIDIGFEIIIRQST